MAAPAPRLPVTVVAGFGGAGKSALIDHWLGTRRAGERWALLANASATEPAHGEVLAPASHRPTPPRGGLPHAASVAGRYRVVGGCACCTAQASARSALIELLRAGPWERLVIELDGAAHPAVLVDLLRSAPLDAHLRVDGIVAVVDASRPGPFETEPMHPLARAQIEVSTHIVLNRAGQLAEERRAALVDRLAAAPPFGRTVQVTDDGRAPWVPGIDDGAGRISRGGSPSGPTLEWRCPADQVFDRARLRAVLDGWAARLPLLGGVGAFRTERDAYQWRLDRSGVSWEACAYRLDNRLLLTLDPRRLADAGDAMAASIEADLAGARIEPAGNAGNVAPG